MAFCIRLEDVSEPQQRVDVRTASRWRWKLGVEGAAAA